MDNEQLVPTQARMLSLERLADSARGYMEQSKAPNTVRAYRADWADFEMWCEHQGLEVLPAAPETIALYLAALADAGAKASTIQRRLSSISQAHQLAGHEPSPTAEWVVRATMSGIRRTLGAAPGRRPRLSPRICAACSRRLPSTRRRDCATAHSS